MILFLENKTWHCQGYSYINLPFKYNYFLWVNHHNQKIIKKYE
jgi:hypothetical protein